MVAMTVSGCGDQLSRLVARSNGRGLAKAHAMGRRSSKQRLHQARTRGFSLLELVIVVSIISIMSTVAVPRYYGILGQQRVEAAARRVVADLLYARRLARQTGTSTTVVFSVVRDDYEIVGMPDRDRVSTNYKVALTQEPYGTTIVSADFGGDASIIFDIFGVPDSGGSVLLRVGNRTQTVTVDAVTGIASSL